MLHHTYIGPHFATIPSSSEAATGVELVMEVLLDIGTQRRRSAHRRPHPGQGAPRAPWRPDVPALPQVLHDELLEWRDPGAGALPELRPQVAAAGCRVAAPT